MFFLLFGRGLSPRPNSKKKKKKTRPRPNSKKKNQPKSTNNKKDQTTQNKHSYLVLSFGPGMWMEGFLRLTVAKEGPMRFGVWGLEL